METYVTQSAYACRIYRDIRGADERPRPPHSLAICSRLDDVRRPCPRGRFPRRNHLLDLHERPRLAIRLRGGLLEAQLVLDDHEVRFRVTKRRHGCFYVNW